MSIFDRAQPQVLLQTARRERARHAAGFGRFELSRPVLGFDIVDALLDGRVLACFRNVGDLGGDRVEIDVNADRQSASSSRIATLFPPLKKRTATLILAVGPPRERFLQVFHEPTDALQSLASACHPGGVFEPSLNPRLWNRQWLSRFVAGRAQPTPAPHDVFVRPTAATLGSRRSSRCK